MDVLLGDAHQNGISSSETQVLKSSTIVGLPSRSFRRRNEYRAPTDMLLMLSNEVRRPASSVWIQAYSLPAADVRSSILLTVASTRMPFAAGARAGALDALGAAAVAMALSTPESAADASTWRSSDCWVFWVGAAAAFASSSSSPASMSSAESP